MAGWLEHIAWDEARIYALAGLRIVLILAVAWLALALSQRAVRAVRMHLATHLTDADAVKRAETLGRVVRYLIAVVVGIVALMLVLDQVGISLAPILGAAGVVGVAIGFGAQSLVKDYFSGFFILFEDQIRTGDVVSIAGIGGSVEDITLRHIRLRDYDGVVHFIPNGLITTVSNMGRGFAYAVVDIGVSYRENTDEVVDVMREVAATLRTDERLRSRILEDFEVAGIERLDDSAVVVRGRFKVVPLAQWDVRREYFRRVKLHFDEAGIEIPYPHLTLYPGVGKDGQGPALSLRIENRDAAGEPAGDAQPARA